MIKLQQFEIFSFHFNRLKNSNFNLSISLDQAKKNDEIIPLADNEVLRAIRRITHHPYDRERFEKLLESRRLLTKQYNSPEIRIALSEINKEINGQLFVPYYISVTTDEKSDYKKIGKNGFLINGEKYVRLLCGAGHARTNRTMFVQEKIYTQLRAILRNGCNDIKMVRAKYNAYFALTGSATYQVRKPFVCVVPDLEVKRIKEVDWVTEDKYQDKVERTKKELTFNLWDGMGLISPRFAEQWVEDLELDYLPSAFLIRCAFIKGMVCIFDFHKFAKEVAKTQKIKDIYGFEWNINDIDLIITQSQFKLWNAYDNWQHYESCLRKSGLQWGISRVTPKEDKNYIRTNYQFVQVLDLKEKDIEELCAPTISWLKNVSGNDVWKSILYLLGKQAKEKDAIKIYENTQDHFLKALFINQDLIKDNYIKNRIVSSLNKRIRETYIGKLLVNGNFQIMINDPYAMCEHIFGLPINGLLKENEYYSDYWNNKNTKKVVGMRSPLTWRSEVNLLNLQNTEQQKEWYKYLYSGIVFNVFGYDGLIHAGSDEDGDLLCTTDNPTFIKCRYGGVPVVYEPKKAEKSDIAEEELYMTDVLSYNTKIGFITNCGTTLYEIQSQFSKDSLEFQEINNRLKLCCKEQSATIDSAKGIKCKPFPKHWTRWTNPEKQETEEERERAEFNNAILIDKRPYFMRYLYPTYNAMYKAFLSDVERYYYSTYKSVPTDLVRTVASGTNEAERYFKVKNPLLITNGVMNNVCYYMESQLSEISKSYGKKYDKEVYEILIDKNQEIKKEDLDLISQAYVIYKNFRSKKNTEEYTFATYEQFYKQLRNVCLENINNNLSYLANLAVEFCYGMGNNRDFVWDIFGNGVVKNLIKKNNHVKMPILKEDGDIEYLCERYGVEEVTFDNIQREGAV